MTTIMKKKGEQGAALIIFGLVLVPLLILVSLNVNSGLLVAKKIQHRGTALELAVSILQYIREDGGRHHTRIKQALWVGEVLASKNRYLGAKSNVSAISEVPALSKNVRLSNLLYAHEEAGAAQLIGTDTFDPKRVQEFFSGRANASGIVYAGNYDIAACKSSTPWKCFKSSNFSNNDLKGGNVIDATLVILNERDDNKLNVIFDFFNSSRGIGGKFDSLSSWAIAIFEQNPGTSSGSYYVYNT